MDWSRIVFERGLELRRDRRGRWLLQCVPGGARQACPAEIEKTYGVRPILMGQGERPDDTTCLLPPGGGKPLNLARYAVSSALLRNAPWDVAARDLSYTLGAACYHCGALAELYAETCAAFASQQAQLGRDQQGRVYFLTGWTAQSFYEFDALVTAVCRCYDGLRYPVWAAFEGWANVPRSFQKMLGASSRIPGPILHELQASWDQCGEKAKQYRDCIQHYAPLGGPHSPCAVMERLQPDVWSASFRLPDNPASQSPRKFTHRDEIDALSFGWELVNKIARLMKSIVDQLAEQTDAADLGQE